MWKTLLKPGLLFLLAGFSACVIHENPPSMNASFNECLRQGHIYLSQGDFERAAGQFKEAIALDDKSAQANNFLGLAYFQLKKYDPARIQFEKAVALDPSYASALNNLGGVYYLQRRFEEARDCLTKALDLDPKLVSAYYTLGELLFYLGDKDGSTSYLAKGISLDPDYLEKHQSTIATISTPDQGAAEMFFSYAELYASAGNIEKTVEYLTKAKLAGFSDWPRINREKEFDKVREDPKIQEFLRES